jgi:hypothetical protein
MRRHESALPQPAPASGADGVAKPRRSDWATLKTLLPYLWQFRWRVGLALLFLVAAKAANVGVPILLKQIVDSLTGEGARAQPPGKRRMRPPVPRAACTLRSSRCRSRSS